MGDKVEHAKMGAARDYQFEGSTQWGPLDRAGGTLVQMGHLLALSLTPGLMWGVVGIVMSQFDGDWGT